jgi:hypothetical protein
MKPSNSNGRICASKGYESNQGKVGFMWLLVVMKF